MDELFCWQGIGLTTGRESFSSGTSSHTVARTVIERSQHVLEVSGKKYRLSVTEHREIPDPDEVRLLTLTGTY